MKNLLLVLLLFLPVHCIADQAAPPEPKCVVDDFLVPEATIDLKRAYVNKYRQYIGVFELVNYGVVPGFRILLENNEKNAFVDRGSAYVEFKDLNGEWRVLNDLRFGDVIFRDSKPVRMIRPGKRLVFRHLMFPQGTVKHGGVELRLKVIAESRTLCVVSFPFQTTPPTLARGLRPIPHPLWIVNEEGVVARAHPGRK
jgi:hypothetical protein